MSKEWRKNRVNKGICVRCDQKAQEGLQHCKECSARMKVQQKDTRKERKAKGLCALGCGRSTVPNKVLCFKCAQKNKQAQKDLYKTRKAMVICGYGSKCQCDGCPLRHEILNPEFLTIDHIDNDGKLDRLRFTGLLKFYKFLIDNNFPKDKYQLLCWNCNCAKALNGGVCPHKRTN
jgi:hypothetical protein